MGGAGGEGASEDPWTPPVPVAPEVSRAWTWEPCGTLEPTAPDQEAMFDGSGQVVVLGPGGVRVHDETGSLVSSTAEPADFLVAAPDGSVLSGKQTSDGTALTPIGASAPSVVLAPAPVNDCGSRLAFSGDGAYLYTTDSGITCAWRVSDAAFVGSIQTRQISASDFATTVLDSKFVYLTIDSSDRMDLVRSDFAGNEVSRLRVAVLGPAVLSPAGDRAVVGADLLDLTTGTVIAWEAAPEAATRPIFSARGEVVLFGQKVFRAADGAHLFSLAPNGRLSGELYASLALSDDGSRAAQPFGRATLFDVEASGVKAVLGPPHLRDALALEGSSDLAISADGSLLVHNVANHVAFGIRLAPSFADSQVAWNMRVELNYGVDVTPDGRFAAIGGDGRAVYDARTGSPVWKAGVPPPEVGIGDICLLDRLRLSPKANWVAGPTYTGVLQVFELDQGQSAEWQLLSVLPGHCEAPIFSHDEQLLATSEAALYRADAGGWKPVWTSKLPQAALSDTREWTQNDAVFSPDEQQLLVSRCGWDSACSTTLLATASGAVTRTLPELTAKHPSFSPEGSWLIAANQLLHLPSGDVRSLGPDADAASPAIFTPKGDIIAGSPNGTLTRYCRSE